MKHSLTVMTFLILLISLLACSGSPDSARSGNEPSQRVTPEQLILNATFDTYDGKTIRIKDLKGKVVLVDFWESWCGPCLRIMPTLSKLATEYPDDIVILAATIQARDTEEEVQAFIKEKGYNLIYVKGGELSRLLNISGIPYKALIQRDGKTVKFSQGTAGADYEYKMLTDAIKLQKAKG